jgi:beta-galactosidase
MKNEIFQFSSKRILCSAMIVSALSAGISQKTYADTCHVQVLKQTTTSVNASPRRTVNFNREWKYMQGDHINAQQNDFCDKDWETIGLPHSFSIPYFMSNDFYVGYGWYRKILKLSPDDLKQSLFLEFDGVFQEAEVFVNGKLTGKHIGGYTGFSVNISSAVKEGDNVIAIRVNNIWHPDVAPRAGEHVFSGGIYRNVRLVMKNPVHIDWYGTFVTTPNLSKNNGKSSVVKVETDICNTSGQSEQYRLMTQVFSPEGTLVTAVESTETIAANTSKKFSQTTQSLQNLQLWQPEHPALYKVISQLYKGNLLLDRDETIFGFRWFEWTADRGFFLNGKHLYFKGANVHQDQAGWGDAVTESAMRRDVQMMKEAGFELIRGSHYPHAPAFSKACDEEGMLFWSEAPFWGIGGFSPDGYWNSSAYPVDEKYTANFEASALQQLEEMIRIHRNHPSIVVWSMSNEAFFSAPSAMTGVSRLLTRMVERCHQLDPTRPAAIGGAQRPLGNHRIDLIGDIAGYNGDGATQPDFQQPSIPNVVSEYGSTTAERPGEYIPGWGDLQVNDGWKGFPWRSGQVIWCGFDHGSIAGSQLGKMGIVDYFRIPKRSWYWYRNEYTGIKPPKWSEEGTPASLKLEATKTVDVLADGTEDVQLLISILDANGNTLSNSPKVQLKLISGPGEFPTGTSILFEPDSDIRIMDGKAAITFRSYYAGKAVIEASSAGMKSARVEITFKGAPAYKPGVTPVTKERPYIRFIRQKDGEVIQMFGRNNPTFASSQQGQQVAGLAADGDIQTFWQAADNDRSPQWTLDTEKGLALRKINIRFPKADAYQYIIQVSDNQKTWSTVMDKSNSTVTEQATEMSFTAQQKPVNARFVRVAFAKSSPAAIAEVEVHGVVLE